MYCNETLFSCHWVRFIVFWSCHPPLLSFWCHSVSTWFLASRRKFEASPSSLSSLSLPASQLLNVPAVVQLLKNQKLSTIDQSCGDRLTVTVAQCIIHKSRPRRVIAVWNVGQREDRLRCVKSLVNTTINS